MNTIPANQLVSVQPGVVGTGGAPLALNAVFLTQNTAVPIGQLLPFGTQAAVNAYFGATSIEATTAAVYFAGFDNSNIKPTNLYFYQYATSPVSAYIVGGNVKGVTLSQITAITAGSLSVTIDGVVQSSTSINLSTATSLSQVASIIGTAISAVVSYNSQIGAFQITSGTTGTTSTITDATGNVADLLLLNVAHGALLSQGAVATDPATAMDQVNGITQNWATFMTLWEPDLDTKLAFAQWTNSQSERFVYVAWDSDANAALAAPEQAPFAVVCNQNAYNGTIPVYLDINVAAFVCGTAASIDFTQLNGRITFAFKGQAGLSPTVTDAQTASNLIANGYNFYGAYATATQQFNLFQPGQITGKWYWADSFINQIFFNAQNQQALMNLLSNMKSIPYNADGYALLRAALQDPINQMLNFGAIRSGVPLSNVQAAEINTAAGLPVDQVLNTFGYYLQILPASVQTRGQRSSPPMTLWYMDGESIQKLNLASIDVM